jgi:hypothetical protein
MLAPVTPLVRPGLSAAFQELLGFCHEGAPRAQALAATAASDIGGRAKRPIDPDAGRTAIGAGEIWKTVSEGHGRTPSILKINASRCGCAIVTGRSSYCFASPTED